MIKALVVVALAFGIGLAVLLTEGGGYGEHSNDFLGAREAIASENLP